VLNEYTVTSGCLPPPSSSASSRASRTGAPGSSSRRRFSAPRCRQLLAHFQTAWRSGARLQCLVTAPLPRPHAPRRMPARRSRQQHDLCPARRRASPHGAGHTPCCPRADAPCVPVPGAELRRARFYQDPDAPDAFADGGSMPRRRRDDGGGEGWQRARGDEPANSEEEEGDQPPSAGARLLADCCPPASPHMRRAARPASCGAALLAGETTSERHRGARQPCTPRRRPSVADALHTHPRARR